MDHMPDGVGKASADCTSPALTPAALATGGEGGAPLLTLDGFSGPLDHLLALGRAQTIDLAAVSLTALLDQLTTALCQAPSSLPLGQKGDWVVMAAWLVQLRTRLLLPAEARAQQDATAEAGQLRDRLVGLQEIKGLAGWLERRPQLGRDVFARGRPPSRAQSPEVFGVLVETAKAVDVVEFLWASLALFDDEAVPVTTTLYRPHPLDLYDVAEARTRIRQRLAETRAARHSIGSCRSRPERPKMRHGRIYAGGRRGPARWSPAWNWPSRGRWNWGSRRFLNPSSSHRLAGNLHPDCCGRKLPMLAVGTSLPMVG